MRTLLLTRRAYMPSYTLGHITHNGIPLCVTVERPWRRNKPSISCIPEGVYIVEPYSSHRFKNCYQVMNVADRTYILFHKGNRAADVEGCIAVGMQFGDVAGMVYRSAAAFEALRDLVGKQPFRLVVEGYRPEAPE